MKKMKHILAAVLAVVFTALLLTACGGSTPVTPQNYGETMEQVMTAARQEYGLSAVKFEESLEAEAKKRHDNPVSGWQYVTIDGQKYKIVYIIGAKVSPEGMQFDFLKKTFESYIERYRNDKNDYISSSPEYVGVENLTHIGLWTNIENDRIEYCLIGTIPAA